MVEPETGQLRGDTPAGESQNTLANATCSFSEDFMQPLDSIYYFRDGDGKIVDIYDTGAPVDTQIVFMCKDSKTKTAYRQCQSDGTWSAQSQALSCDKWRYLAAVIAAATSAAIVVVIIIYFSYSAYNKNRKKRKYTGTGSYRNERVHVREQDHVMRRNENFVRLNFKSFPLSIHPDASAAEDLQVEVPK